MPAAAAPTYRATCRSLALAAAALVIAVGLPAYGGTASLGWDPVSDADLAGYRIYYGTSPTSYAQYVDVGNVTQATISGLTDCTNYYFGIKAYDTSGNESTAYSNEVQGWSRPIVTSSTPSSAEAGRTLSLTIAGSNFPSGATALFSNAGITVNSTTVNACGQLTLNVTVAAGAAPGASSLDVTDPDRIFGTGTAIFAVASAAAPTVASTSPHDGTSGVSTAVTPGVTFSEALLPASITAANVKLLDSTGAVVAQRTGSPSLSANGLTATITPATGLAQGKTYRIQVVGGASGVLDLALHGMASTFTQTTGFTTTDGTALSSITAVGPSNVLSTAATITWTTNAASDSQVFYRRLGGIGFQQTSVDGALVTSHSSRLDGLDPSTTYEYYVRSADAAGNAAISSPTQTFATTASSFTYLRFEAESGTLVSPVQNKTGAAFGSGYVDTPSGTPIGDATAPSGTATFGVNIPSDGTWNLWVRMYAPDAGTDTWFESIDGVARQKIAPTVTGQWQWVAGRSYALTAGLSRVELGAGDAQARVDRILLTDDSTFTPTEQPVDDQTPPASDIGLTARAGSAQVTLDWANSSSLDFSRTIIRYRTDGQFPVSPVDGLGVVVKPGAAGSTDSFVHTGLSNGTTYSYSAFAEDASGNVSPAATATAIPSDVPAPTGVALVQHAAKDAGWVTSSSQAFPASNSAGNLIAVVVRVGRSNAVVSVDDTSGNIYRQAARLDVTVDQPNGDTLAILYAENVQPGTNTVSVSSSLAGATLRFAILEYAGVAGSNSLDGTAVTQGSDAAPNSGFTTTTANGDLVLGAVMTGDPAALIPGNGFTQREQVGAKLLAEDRIQTSAGPAYADAALLAGDEWGAIVAAFRAAPQAAQPDLTLTKTHTGTFVQGQPAATYTLTVTNAGSAASVGTVTVTDAVPVGLVATGMEGAGWSCTLATTTCTREDALAPAESYPPIALTVSVDADAASSVTNTASVEGGGELNTGNDTASDVTPIQSAPVTQPPISLVQHRGLDAGNAASSSLAFPMANVAGNLIVVAIRAPSNRVLTVTDSLGNGYQKAIQVDNTVDGVTVAIYYAENIAAGPNTVTVSKSQGGGTLRLAILEYSGVAPAASLDVTAGAQGFSANPDSGAVAPASGGELAIGVVATANRATFTADDGFMIDETVPAAPDTKLLVEDQTQTTGGSLSAGATLISADDWAAIVATFRAR